ncbi:MAG: nicotinate-nucleotide adenylyltransferase [Pseudomonadota bacterium]
MISTRSQFQRVGLLGGSFNPPHAGHREISLAAIAHLDLDAVWWLVTPGNPLKDPDQYAPYETRLSVARAMSAHERIVVSNFEARRNLQYTVDTLDALVNDYPAMRFVWIMGADSLETFHKWRDWKRIAELAPIAVFNRPGYQSGALESEAATTLAAFRLEGEDAKTLVDAEPPAWAFFEDTHNPMSSTELRRAAENGEK